VATDLLSTLKEDSRTGLCDALWNGQLPHDEEWLCDWRDGGAPGRSTNRTGTPVPRCPHNPATRDTPTRPVVTTTVRNQSSQLKGTIRSTGRPTIFLF
jgi:hypothetical protein